MSHSFVLLHIVWPFHFSPHIQDDLKSRRAELEASLLKIITAPSPYPAPGRAIRHAVARCFIVIFTRAESRTLFDTFKVFLRIAGDVKLVGKEVHRM